MGQWQEDNVLAPRQDDTLGALESMGIQLLSSILSPEATSSTASSTSATSSSRSTTATSTSASSTSSASGSSSALAASRSASAASAAAETSSATPTPVSSSGSGSSRHRNIAIIVGSVLGAVVVLLALALLVFCCMRGRRRGRSTRGRSPEKILDDDDDELDGLHSTAGGPGMAYVTRIESWHEPRNSRSTSRGPPKGSQSRVSLVRNDAPPLPASERYNNGPGAPVPIPVPPPHRSSSYGLIQNDSPYDAPGAAYFDRPHRHSMDDASRDSNRYPGYTPYRSTHSLVERSPTPLFGSGKTPGEVNPSHTIKRKSVGSASQAPTMVNSAMNSKDPSPHHIGNGNGPFIPPRSKRRESLPGSPLQHEFEFGFDNTSPNQPRRISRGERMPGAWSSNSVADAHQRF